MGRSDIHIEVWWGNLKEVDHLEDTAVDGAEILGGFRIKQPTRCIKYPKFILS
jgi:hypothetical protein